MPRSEEPADTFDLATLVQGVNVQDPNFEKFLHSRLDFLFGRIRVDFEGDFVVQFLLQIAFFRDDRTPDDRIEVLHDP